MSRTWLAGTLLLAGCATSGTPSPSGEPPGEPAPAEAPARDTATQELVPAGYGTLHQDEVTVSLREGPLLLKVTPLAEAVTRLTAPDTYDRLRAVAASRGAEAERAAMRPSPSLWLVSFFSYEPDVTYQPEDLRIAQQAQLFRPLAIVPMTSGWGRQRLRQQDTQSAVYAFEGAIDLEIPFTVQYGTQRSEEWGDIIRRIEVERAKVRSRAGTGGGAER